MLATRRLLFPIFLLILVSFVVCVALSTRAGNERLTRHSDERVGDVPGTVKIKEAGETPAYHPADPNRAQGLAAWERVYSVLISPRCINCHTATNYPQQGDDRRRHFANVVRGGEEGQGVPGLH